MRYLTILLGIGIVVLAFLTFRARENGPLIRMSPPEGGGSPSARLPKLWPLPDFSLTERSGGTVTLASLKGSIWLAGFIYTTCPGPCPMISSRMSAVQQAIGEAPDFRLVSITTDPDKDTPDVLQAYAKRFGAGVHWLFLTGAKDEIYALSNRGFKLSLSENLKLPEPITHSTKLVLIDREGVVRALFDGTDAAELPRILSAIATLRSESQ